MLLVLSGEKEPLISDGSGPIYSGFEASDSDNEDHDKDGFSSFQDENEAPIEVQDESDQSEASKNGNREEPNQMEVKRSSEKDVGSDDEGQNENPDVKQQKKCSLPHCNSVVHQRTTRNHSG